MRSGIHIFAISDGKTPSPFDPKVEFLGRRTGGGGHIYVPFNLGREAQGTFTCPVTAAMGIKRKKGPTPKGRA
jgi:hypothetical protein